MVLTEQEANLICRVLSSIKGNISQVTKAFLLRQTIWTTKTTEVELSVEDLNAISGVISGYSGYTPDEVPTLMSTVQVLAAAVKAKNPPAEEPKNESPEPSKNA